MNGPNYEVFHREQLRASEHPTVTVTAGGVLGLNGSAVTALGSPTAVHLLYDREADVIGLRAIDNRDDPTAFALTRTRSIGGGANVAARSFLNHYAVDRASSRRYRADMADGVLCVDLRSDPVPVTSNRAAARRPAPANPDPRRRPPC